MSPECSERIVHSMSESYFYGGQAVMEGVMMRGRKTFAVACRAPNGDIVVYEGELKPGPVLRRVRGLPFVRGAVVLWDTLILGMRSLMFSANVSLQEEEDGAASEPAELGGFPWATLTLLAIAGGLLLWFVAPFLSETLNGWLDSASLERPVEIGVPAMLAALLLYMGIDVVRSYRRAVERAAAGIVEEPEMLTGPLLWATVGLSLAFSVALFFVVPVAGSAWLERFVDSHLAVNLIEGLLRFGLLVGYLALISRMEDIRRVFAYHGAEHKTIHAHEQGLPLDVEHIRPQPLEHIRCGTGFLLIVVLISVIMFSLLGRPDRKSTRLNSSHVKISYAVFCLKKKNT